jgi:hypothetical protein
VVLEVCLFLARQPPVGQGLLIHEVSRSHSTRHHSRLDSSGRVISSSQRPLPYNTQHSLQTYVHGPPVGFEPTISAAERPQAYALDYVATGTGDLRSTQFKSMLSSLSPLFDRHFGNSVLVIGFLH